MDEWPSFFRLLPVDRHFYGKDLTYRIEQTNSDTRHQLARFTERTKAPSRSLVIVALSLKLAHHLPDILHETITIYLYLDVSKLFIKHRYKMSFSDPI